jgi:hypothetical protein
VLTRLAGAAITSPLAFLVAGVTDLLAYWVRAWRRHDLG